MMRIKTHGIWIMVAASVLAATVAHGQTTFTWANSNVSGTPVSPLDWFSGGPNTQGTWAGGDPISSNGNTIQFFEDTATALPNTATPSTQTVNLNNGGNAFQLGTLTLSGRGSATTNANLEMILSGDALNFSGGAGTINLNAVNNTRTITNNVNNAIQLGTASSGTALTITGNGSSAFIIGGNITELSAGSSLIKSGSSIVTLTGTNTYSGGTIINSGTISINGNNALGANGTALAFNGSGGLTMTEEMTFDHPVALNNNAVLSVNTTGNPTFSGAITGDGHINWVTGSGSPSLSSPNNTFTGNLTLPTANGTLLLGFASIGDGGLISFRKSGYRANVGYTGSVCLVLNNRRIDLTSSFGGVGDGMGYPVNMFENNGTGIVIFNKDMTVATNRTGTFFFGGSNTGNNTFAGVIPNSTGGALSISTYGTGKWIFTNDNTFAGNAIAGGGILSVGKIANAGVAQPLGAGSIIQLGYRGSSGSLEYKGSSTTTDKQVQIGDAITNQGGTGGIINNGTGALTFSAATFNIPLAGVTVSRTLTLGGANSGSNTISGIIQNNAAGGLVNLAKTGSGKWVLSGTNTFTGATTLSGGGTLVLDYSTADNSKLSDTSALSVSITGNSGGGRLILSGGSHPEIIGPTNTLNNGTGLWIARTSGFSTLQLNTISRPNGQAAISFSEDSIASADNSNVNGILGCWATVGTNWAVNSNPGADGAIVGLTSYETNFPTATGDSTKNYQLTGSQTQTLDTTGNSLRLVNGGNSDVLALGTRTLTPGAGHNAGILYVGGFDNSYTITGSGAGVIKSATGNNTLSINVFTGTLTVNALLNSGTAATLKYGVGALVIGGSNTVSGPLFVLDGTARLTHNNAAGTTAGGITVQNGAALELANSVTIGAEALTITGTGISDGGALRNIAGEASTYGGTITIGDSGARINSDGGASLTLSAASAIVTAPLKDATIGGSGNTTISGVISGAGNLIKDGSGKLILSGAGANTLSGETLVNSGIMQIASTAANAIADSSTLCVASGAKLELGSGVNETVGVFYLDGQPASPGTWGGLSSGATNKDAVYFTGTGVITVLQPGTGTPYKAQGPAGTVIKVK